MSEPVIRVRDDVAAAVAGELSAQVHHGGSVVLTGGNSVAEAYERTALLAPDWSQVEVWWGDERAVPPDDERSNYLLAKRTLLDRLEQGPREVHRIRGELEPADAAGEYDRALEGAELGLLLLGVGPDGHIASLFPGTPQLHVRDRRATSGPAGLEPFVDRITMTLPTLLSAARIVLVATGASKAEAIARALEGPIADEVPASLLRTGNVPITVYLDAAAASQLDNPAEHGVEEGGG